MTKWKALAWGFGGAFTALVLYSLGSTAWIDHERVNALWNRAIQEEQQRQAAMAPPHPAPAPQPAPQPEPKR